MRWTLSFMGRLQLTEGPHSDGHCSTWRPPVGAAVGAGQRPHSQNPKNTFALITPPGMTASTRSLSPYSGILVYPSDFDVVASRADVRASPAKRTTFQCFCSSTLSFHFQQEGQVGACPPLLRGASDRSKHILHTEITQR
jgi:hypothetical protein